MSPTRCFALSALFATLLAVAPAGAKDPLPAPKVETLLTMHVDGDVFIELDGSVSEFRIETAVPEAMRAVVAAKVRSWRFHPVLIEGAPARVVSRMRLTLAATKTADDYEVRVDNVVFPKPAAKATDAEQAVKNWAVDTPAVSIRVRSMKPPVYPATMNKAGVGGRVLLGLRMDAEGRVAEVVALQSMMFDVAGREKTLARAIEQLEEVAIDAARKWRYEVVAKGAPLTAKDLTGVTTVEFVPWQETKGGPRQEPAGQWRWVSRLPKRQMPWLAPEARQDVGVNDVLAGEMFPLASDVKLQSDVVGRIL